MKSSGLVAGGIALWLAVAGGLRAEDRSFDGTGNNLLFPERGVAGEPLIRINYPAVYPPPMDGSVMLSDANRRNPRDISNIVAKQNGSLPNSRGLSDMIWAWGQFLDHDMSHTLTSDGPEVNGFAPIAVTDPDDILYTGPGSMIPFTRSNFTLGGCGVGGPTDIDCRGQTNELTSFIDASQVYGSDATRAAALRTDGGTGARLQMSSGDLLPLNTAGLPNENRGPLPDEQLFLAGDMRSNENVLLSSMHTVFAREHNRLVDIIESKQPSLNDEETYQLARKIVGAEIQAVTYNEFLPALLGGNAPSANEYDYDANVDASITQSFAHAIYRWGHSTVSPEVQFVNDNGTAAGSLNLQYAFSNPAVITDDADKVEQLLRGAATQVSQELDVYVVEELRSLLFGPPGSGGLDLAALNIQRGRDHGLPDFDTLSGLYLGPDGHYGSIEEITSDPEVRAHLIDAYDDNHLNIDPWVGALAEDHLEGTSAGRLITTIMVDQFERLRDGDRLFYLSDEAGLYLDGTLRAEIAEIIDLDDVALSEIIRANTALANLQENVFFAESLVVAGDYNNDGVVSAADYVLWRNTLGSTTDLRANGDDTGASATLIDEADYLVWKNAFVANAGGSTFPGEIVPEPQSLVLVLLAVAAATAGRVRGD